MTAHIPNGELTPKRIPPRDADFAEEIFPFAMAYHAYDVWGDVETVQSVAEGCWRNIEQSKTFPTSLLKLRTSLFGAGRYMRVTDFDEDVIGGSGTEAAWVELMRQHVSAIAAAVDRGAKRHLELASAAAAAAARITQLEKASEHDLRVAIGQALAASSEEPVASSATVHEHSFGRLPLWAEDDPPGPFDLVVGEVAAPSAVAEVKLSDHNTLSHSLWDIVKLLGVVTLSADHAYLIAGYPQRVWQRTEFAALYEGGTLPYTALPIAKEWPYLLEHSKGTPLRVPNALEVTEIARVNFRRDGEAWQLRTVAIEPAAGGWLALQNGGLEGAEPCSAE